MNKKVITLAVFFILLALSIQTIDALGVTSAYYEGNPLTLYPGETRTVGVSLTNMVGDQNITLVANMTKGTEIAHLLKPIETQYFVPFGTNNELAVDFVVSIPSTASIGTEYSVEITLTTVTSGAGGGVVMGSSIGKEIPIKVISPTPITEEKAAFPTWIIIAIIVIVILLIIVLIILSKKKKK
jgi:hypothetical protein